jgi:hypothetical protein
MLKIPEKIIVRQILGYLRTIGAYCGKVKTVGIKRGKTFCFDPFLMRGVPDVICFYNRKMYFFEVKSGKNLQSKEQRRFQEECDSSSVNYYLIYSLEDVQKIIKKNT